jgi:hypothetical protein
MSTAGTSRAKSEVTAESHLGTAGAAPVAKKVGYGLPCANCGTYYAADQTACPICSCPERVPANATAVVASPRPEVTADLSRLDEEREQFLKEYKEQLFSAHSQIDPAASFCCSLHASHQESYEPASVCKTCYDQAQHRADLVEAALHIDLQEATQIVYDAVWADTSDSSKSYQNAALALLTELRKRAGINMVLTTLQPYTH